MHSIAYHQNAVLYIIIAKMQPTVDDIRLSAMIYTLKRDDMPLLSQWIKKDLQFCKSFLVAPTRIELVIPP